MRIAVAGGDPSPGAGAKGGFQAQDRPQALFLASIAMAQSSQQAQTRA
jgi:hypothetical protein